MNKSQKIWSGELLWDSDYDSVIHFEKINDLYNVNCKEAGVFKQQLQLMSDPVCIPDFLSPQEVEELKQIERSKPASWRQGRPNSEATEVTFNNWETDEQRLLRSRLEKVIGGFDVWGGNYFSTSVPYLPHVDTGIDLLGAVYKNVVIPLEIDPPGTETYLVLFRQRYFGNNTGFYASGVGGLTEYTCNDSLYDYSRVFNLEPAHQISEEILKTHLHHVDPANLKGFSISHILPWKVGSCLIFDSAQIHCSSDFTIQGIRRKAGYSIFTIKV